MNFIAATVELKSLIPDPINAYGLEYRGADAVVPAGNSAGEVRFRILCYNREGAKLDAFQNWKPGTRALITGNIAFADDTSKPLDLIVSTIEANIPQDMYCNQVVLVMHSSVTTKLKNVKMKLSPLKLVPRWTTLKSLRGFISKHTTPDARNSLKESARDALSVCKVTSASIGRTILIAPTGPLSRLTSLLERKASALDGIRKRTEQRRATRKSTPRPITKGAKLDPPYWWEQPIYKKVK